MNHTKFLSNSVLRLFLLLFSELCFLLVMMLCGVSRSALIAVLVFLLLGMGLEGFFLVWIPYQKLEKHQNFLAEQLSVVPYTEIECDFSDSDRRYKEYLSRQVDQQEQLRLEVRESEILALQNQINPHFLYNTLEAIRCDAMVYGVDSIAETTEALADFFRYTISVLDRFVTLSEELHNVETYMAIQRYRFGEAVNLEIQIAGEVCGDELYMPKMILQPLVENSIIHGLENKEHMGTVTVDIIRTESLLQISVRDDGIGMEEALVKRLNHEIRSGTSRRDGRNRRGIALRNVHERIRLLFGEDYGVQLFSISGVGTEARISLPICTEERSYET